MSLPITSEIAKAIRDALTTVIADTSVRCHAMGVEDTDGATRDTEAYPAVSVWVRECGQLQYRSTLRDYPVRITVATWSPADRFGATAASLAETVGAWIRAGTALTLDAGRGVTWKAIYIPDAPEPVYDEREGGVVWGQAWNGDVKVQSST
jgi:hypothetical protein